MLDFSHFLKGFLLFIFSHHEKKKNAVKKWIDLSYLNSTDHRVVIFEDFLLESVIVSIFWIKIYTSPYS